MSGDYSSLTDVSKNENVSTEKLARNILAGRCIVLKNDKRAYTPCAIGEDVSVKVNVNIGTSGITCFPEMEIEKAKAAILNGADAIMDLSTGWDIVSMRREILKLDIPVCTVPIYEAVRRAGNVVDLDADTLFNTIRDQAKEGVDFMTLHC